MCYRSSGQDVDELDPHDHVTESSEFSSQTALAATNVKGQRTRRGKETQQRRSVVVPIADVMPWSPHPLQIASRGVVPSVVETHPVIVAFSGRPVRPTSKVPLVS
jgi:hypothetical protein